MDLDRAVPQTVLAPDGVVVAFDGSPGSSLALEWAARVAPAWGAPLQLLTAVDVDLHAPRSADGPGGWRRAADALLDRGAQLALDAGAPTPERLALLVPPAEAVAAVAGRARMVVVGAQGHSRVGGLVLGSVSQRVTRHCPCSVAVVRLPARRATTDVVVGLDDDPRAAATARVAFELASALDGSVVAMHGWAPLSGERTVGRLPPAPQVVDRERDGEVMLAAVCAPWRARYPDVDVVYEAIPVKPADLLRDASAGAAALVVGSRGRSAVGGLLLGSVSQSVLSHAACSVVVAR